MIKFNDNNILVGYIKQLLHTFNLPTCKVFNSEDECISFYSKYNNLNQSIFCIVKKFKDNRDCIVAFNLNTKEFKFYSYYIFGNYYLNLTKTLVLDGNLYTSYTHSYLGEYLRFIKNYKNINLMPLYNCYDSTLIEDDDYKYLCIPVKYGETYTVKLNSNVFNYVTSYTINKKEIQKLFVDNLKTGKSGSQYFVIKIETPSTFNELNNEKNYRLIIRLPKQLDIPLTVLEGDYSQIPDTFTNIKVNYEHDYSDFDLNKLISNLSLLQDRKSTLDSTNYPFSDRLIEYLCDNVITNDDSISRDIIDAKYKLYLKYELTPEGNPREKDNILKPRANLTNNDRLKLLNAVNINKLSKINNSDMLFYIDKDVEAVLNDKRYPEQLVIDIKEGNE